MDWNAVESPPDQVVLAQALVDVTARRGWNGKAMAEASQAAFGAPHHWREVFPHGAKDAIWFISRISDASMQAAFDLRPAPDMTDVIVMRFDQNSDLKAFVRQVMLFDILHPIQALARMQRTARVMMTCTTRGRRTDWFSLTRLNLVYTVIVFIWLFDKTPRDRRTVDMTRWAVETLGI